MQLVIMRHGQTDFNVDHRYAGVLDVPLNDEGRRQARRAGTAPDVELVHTSHLSRARETARICFPQARQIVLPQLAEMNFGAFQGRTPDEMENDAAYRTWVESWCTLACPQGDSRDAYTRQVAEAVCDIVFAQKAADAKRVVIVGHGGTIMATFASFVQEGEARDYYQWNPGNCNGYCADIVFADDPCAAHGDTSGKPFELANIRLFTDVRFLNAEQAL